MAAKSSSIQVIYAALIGNLRSRHPIGFGHEIYFWSFSVALLVFALGAVVSIDHGILHVESPEPIHDAFVNYVVLGLAFLFEGALWWAALKDFSVMKGKHSYCAAFRGSKNPPSFVVFSRTAWR